MENILKNIIPSINPIFLFLTKNTFFTLTVKTYLSIVCHGKYRQARIDSTREWKRNRALFYHDKSAFTSWTETKVHIDRGILHQRSTETLDSTVNGYCKTSRGKITLPVQITINYKGRFYGWQKKVVTRRVDYIPFSVSPAIRN